MMDKLKSYISDVSYYWKVAALLAFSMAIIPTLALIYIHQGALAVIGLAAVAFPIVLNWVIKESALYSPRFEALVIKVDWKVLWLVFVVGYSIIVIWALVGIGVPEYRDERAFYAEKDQIEKKIKSGNLDAVRDLGLLYLEKSAPIPYLYNYQAIQMEGVYILDKWLTEKVSAGSAKDYINDMDRFASLMFPQNKVLARKWFYNASKYGHKHALKHLKTLDANTAVKREELRRKRIQDQKTKDRENTNSIKSLGENLGKLKRETSDSIDKFSSPIKKKWQEFQEGFSEGESSN